MILDIEDRMRDSLISIFQDTYKLCHKYIKELFPNYSFSNIAAIRYIISKLMSLRANKIKTALNITLYLDKNDSLGLTFSKEYESLETLFVQKTIKESMTVIDVGANIGYYTTIFSKFSQNGTVYAFEPDAINFSLLQRNCDTNKLHNVKLFNCACGNVNKTESIYISKDNKGDHRTYKVDGEERESNHIKMIRLDDFLPTIPKLDFVKLDIQGYEFEAIRGMNDLITKHKPIILLEFWPAGLIANNEKPQGFLEYLCDLNYDVHSLSSIDNNYKLEKVDIVDHMSISETSKNDLNIVLTSRS
jgi:FkbM family methyltransferase